MISINYATYVIFVPQSFLTTLGGLRYRLDVNALRNALKGLEDDPAGMAQPDTHRHSTESTLSGVTYARQVEVLPPYTVEFENGMYQVECVGANHNLLDRKVVNSVSLVIGNSAGLIAVATGGGSAPTAADVATAVWAKVLEGLTAEQMMRIMLSVLAGKRRGLGTTAEEYMAQDGLTPRVTLTADTYGNGTPTLNGAL